MQLTCTEGGMNPGLLALWLLLLQVTHRIIGIVRLAWHSKALRYETQFSDVLAVAPESNVSTAVQFSRSYWLLLSWGRHLHRKGLLTGGQRKIVLQAKKSLSATW